MAKYDYVHLCKFEGKDIPDALLDAVLKEHQSCAGVAIEGAVVEGTELPYLGTFLQAEGAVTKDVQALLSAHKDKKCYLSFGKFPKEFSEDNVQPYVALFDDEGNTTMAVFMGGNFEEKAKAESPESSAFQVYKRLVLPQILKASKNHEDEPGKAFEEMASDPAIAELMTMFYKDAGAITVVCNAGSVTWGEGMQHPFDFGWATNPCGYTEKKAEPEAPAKSKSGFSLGGFKKTAAKEPEGFPKGSPTVSKLEAAKNSASTVSLPSTDNKPADDDDYVWTSPPSAWTKDQKRKWYLTYNLVDGKPILPDGYKNCPKVKVLKSMIDGSPKSQTVKAFNEIDKDKVVTSSNTQVTTEALPIISPKSKKYLVDVFMKKGHVQKTISAEGKVIIDPKRAEEMTADWPTFVEAGGMEDIRQTLSFTHEDRKDLLDNASDALLVLLQDTQLALYNVLKEHNQLDLKIATPAPAPAKKAALSFKK